MISPRGLLEEHWPEIGPLLERARGFLETKWSERHAQMGIVAPTISHDMCCFTVGFLEAILRDVQGGWNAVGGVPLNPDGTVRSSGGMRDPTGAWQGHYWIVDENEELALDITADQFGYGAIEIRFADDELYDPNFDESEVAEHLHNCAWRSKAWLAEWRSLASAPSP